MPHGGSRPGAGRKKGSTTKRTRDIADRHERQGKMMPFDVMLFAMNRCVEAGDWDGAHLKARDAAPFCHAKLQSLAHTGADGEGPVTVSFRWEDAQD